MGEKWKRAPVFYTLAQIVFNPISQMEKYVSEIQDRLRISGYPDFRVDTNLHFAVQLDPPEVEQTRSRRWSFANANRTEGYLLLPNAITYHTTEHDTFDQFSAKVIAGLKEVHAIVKLAFVEQIGLRFLDAISPGAGQTVAEYLDPSLLGMSAKLQGTLKHSFSETLIDTVGGLLRSKVMMVEGGLPVPPDLHPILLNLPERFRGRSGRNATLDNDCVSAGRILLGEIVEIESMTKKLQAIKQTLDDAFRASTTDLARKEWV